MPSILIIEDDVSIARALEEKLWLEGFEAHVLLWGDVKGNFISSHHPDLILLDLMLPEHSGLEVLRELRSNPKTSQIPVIILSAFGGDDMKKATGELGIAAYLVKDETTLDEVTAKVREILKK